ncbi:hypothetical protein D3C76_382910 [compost metagenome]
MELIHVGQHLLPVFLECAGLSACNEHHLFRIRPEVTLPRLMVDPGDGVVPGDPAFARWFFDFGHVCGLLDHSKNNLMFCDSRP